MYTMWHLRPYIDFSSRRQNALPLRIVIVVGPGLLPFSQHYPTRNAAVYASDNKEQSR